MSWNEEYDERGNVIVPLDRMMPSLLLRVPAMPYDMGMHMLRIKYGKFARRTGCVRWRFRLELQREVRRYPLPLPDGYFLHVVKDIHWGHYGRSQFPNYWRGWRGMFRGFHFHVDETDCLVLDLAPKRDDLMHITVSTVLLPKENVDTLQETIYEMYGDDIAAGVAAECMNQKNKPWYDPGNSVRLEKQFNSAINDEMARMERDKTGTAYMRTRRFI